jgi:signal transduction histidine kinase
MLALLLVAAAALTLQIRSQVSAATADLERAAAAAGDLPAKVTPPQIQAFLAAVPAPAALTGRFGQTVAATGPTELWARGQAGWIADLATTGSSATVIDGAVQVTQQLGSSRAITLRRDVGRAATTVSGSTMAIVGGLALLLALLTGAVVYTMERRRAARLARALSAGEALAAGRRLDEAQVPDAGELAPLGTSLRTISERLEHLGAVADQELAVLAAAIEPLPVGVAGRGPAGGRLRNLALERLIDDLPAGDRDAVESAVQEGLDAQGPVGTRVALMDGRLMEVDGWSVPGGRLVSVAERTEQERLANFRRQLEGSAIRQLRAPIDEIKARSSELYKQLPAPAAPTLRAVFAATDRLDRVVRMMLRGTAHDPALRPPRRETFGVAGMLWGLVHDWDRALRQRALRCELEIAPDLPDVRTDPALVEEILTELVDNAAKYTPRGGTVCLAARPGERTVVIEVSDTGQGFSREDVPHATERFFRGRHSESIPGAGLGLGVAAALAERLGGVLVIEPGPGGHARLELPAAAPVPDYAGIG